MSNGAICKPYDSTIHHFMTGILRILTVIAGLTILAGGILLLVHQGSTPTHFHTFSGEPESLKVVPDVVVRAFHGEALDIVQLGILLLIATPVLRVVFVGIGYLIERDWLYVLVALIVLAVLGSSLIGHKL
jgi:uncharacterized membrane protein